jgi:hypothetical protein
MISHRQLLPTCGRTAPQQLASAKLMVSSLWSTAHSKSKPAGMAGGESNRLKAGLDQCWGGYLRSRQARPNVAC